ncbi:MAG: hypothetical protein F9K40_03645 [Kofleriaceae bacterium]|nr:MAG: hypothetical protein F9K40_03645 [Kofleriaceae bacterium]MBZ0233518.1 hypothetical protein [Kofleriaceae bacterium]
MTKRVLAVSVLLLWVSSRTADADDCHAVAKGTALYVDEMAETRAGKTTADVVGWFGREPLGAPTIALKLVALDGDEVQRELSVYVRRGDARAVACPSPWRRGEGERVALTWPDARHAGQAVRTTIAGRMKKAKRAHGRACFAAGVPGVSATVCADVAARRDAACVAVAAGKPVYTRPSTKHRLGETTEQVVATMNARVGSMLAVWFEDADASIPGYVRVSDTTPAPCPDADAVGSLHAIPPYPALLADGTYAGFRTFGPGLLGAPKPDVRTVRGRTLSCGPTSPAPGLRATICIETSADP